MVFDRRHLSIGAALAITAAVVVGCAQLTPLLKTEKLRFANLQNDNQIKIIENFDSPDEINEIGGKDRIAAGSETYLKSEYLNEDAIAKSGQSLALAVSLPAHVRAAWESGLSRLDVSKADAVFFWAKNDSGIIAQQIVIELTDTGGTASVVKANKWFQPQQEGTQWRECIIPRAEFKRIDFNSLQRIRFIFDSGDTPLNGRVLIDNIGFVGPEMVYFLSLKDNLFSYPSSLLRDKRRKELLKASDEKMLAAIAHDTWKYFDEAVDKRSWLPIDTIKVDNEAWIGDYTSPTNIGLYLMALVGARDLGLISDRDAQERAMGCLRTVEKLASWEGFLYNFYNTTTLMPTSNYVSTVDSGWFAAGLIVARQTFDGEIAHYATLLLERMDFGALYDEELGQLRIGYDTQKDKLAEYHYGMLVTEARITSLIGIGKGDIPREHWFRIHRTLPVAWDWQTQKPEGHVLTYDGINVFEGWYTYAGRKIVPSWGGSLFEFLMPTLVVKEREMAPRSFGLNNRIATEIHIKYALKEKKYSVWGLSPCSVPSKTYGGYAEFGIAAIGAKGYRDEGVVTPHVSFLALDTKPRKAIANIRAMLNRYEIYGEYGLYDAVAVRNGKVSYKYLALDQAMTFIALVNYLHDNSIKERFHADPITAGIEELIQQERFF